MLKITNYTSAVLTCLMLANYTQANLSNYHIRSISVVGNYTLDDARIIHISGLDEKWTITREDLQQATNNLWTVGIFSDIKISILNHDNNTADLTISLNEYPRLKNLYVTGVDAFEADQIKDKINVEKYMLIAGYKLFSIRQNLKEFYISKGYLTVNIDTYIIPSDSGLANLIVRIEEGEEIEIEQIIKTLPLQTEPSQMGKFQPVNDTFRNVIHSGS